MTKAYPDSPILLVDDEQMALDSYSAALKTSRIDNIEYCQESGKVLGMLREREYDAILLDIRMPGISGMDLLVEIKNEFPEAPVIMLTGVDELEIAVESMKAGAFDYMVKPVDKGRLVSGVRRAIEFRSLEKENISLRRQILSDKLENPAAFEKIVTQNPVMRSIFKYIETVAISSRPVLISGETGVGKELIAEAIHNTGGRDGSFVTVNAAGLDDTMFSDTLFGHIKGAFTGADENRAGLIVKASGGSLFLDEVADLSEASQVKLLRLLQEGEYYPLGSDKPKYTDAHVIVATNLDLQNLVEHGKFRKDLYYRLSVHQINVPPLRERRDDLPQLVDHFLEETANAMNKKKPTPPRELFTLLPTYHFPGNIRELQNMVLEAVTKHRKGKLSLETFKNDINRHRKIGGSGFDNGSQNGVQLSPFKIREDFDGAFPTLKEAENYLIGRAMNLSKENQTIAAELLGITRLTLNKRLQKLNRKG